MSRFEIKNWCPGALRPMQSGDGLVVRVRPRGSRLSPTQAKGIAETSAKHGNGLIDLTARANVQLRGVRDDSHEALVGDLKALGLVDHDIAGESRRNIVVTPFRDGRYGLETAELAAALETLLERGPELPGKFGFAIDTGPAPVLAETSADIRLERDASGILILRADGAKGGRAVTPSEAPGALLDLAFWFVRSGGVREGRGRMAAHIASGAKVPDKELWTVMPAAPAQLPLPGPRSEGFLVGAEFGQLSAAVLGRLAAVAHVVPRGRGFDP
jgi:precorrin-3B synthase